MISHKKEHYVEDIRRHLISIIYGLKDPRIKPEYFSIVKVAISKDTSICKIYISSIKGSKKANEIAKVLEKAAGYIKKELDKNLKLKYIPQLIFEVTDSIEYGVNMNKKLNDLKANDLKSDLRNNLWKEPTFYEES